MTLREWLKKNNLTQLEMAKDIRVDRSYLSSIIAGSKIPARATALKIEKYTNGKITLANILIGAAGEKAIYKND